MIFVVVVVGSGCLSHTRNCSIRSASKGIVRCSARCNGEGIGIYAVKEEGIEKFEDNVHICNWDVVCCPREVAAKAAGNANNLDASNDQRHAADDGARFCRKSRG